MASRYDTNRLRQPQPEVCLCEVYLLAVVLGIVLGLTVAVGLFPPGY